MSVSLLNNVETGNEYSDALTVEFSFARESFSIQVFNAGIFYQLATFGPAGTDTNWENREHFLPPSLTNFRNPTSEGFATGSMFAGIKVRSAVSSLPARVTVA